MKKRKPDSRLVTGFKDYTSVRSALEIITSLTKPKPRTETVATKNAYGRVVSEDIASPINVPDRQRSHMDGYAVASRDLNDASPRAPRFLSFVGEMNLAEARARRLLRGETMGIATGGELPVGADAVIPVEDTERIGNRVYFRKAVEKGHFCFPIGADVQKGSVVIHARSEIRAQDIGMLVFLGIRELQAYAKPKVALIATGDELVDPFDNRDGPMVRDSHSPIFEHLVRELGGVTISREIIRDDLALMSIAAKRALRNSDIVITLGGTSLGKADLVERTLQNISRKSRIIHGIRMDRGRVAGIAAVRGKPVIMLPGPVQGAMNAFILLALPLISRMIPRDDSSMLVRARLDTNWRARGKFKDFIKVLYVRIEKREDAMVARPFVGATESISVLTNSNGYVVVPERLSELRSGDAVSVRLLPGFSYVGGRFPSSESASLS